MKKAIVYIIFSFISLVAGATQLPAIQMQSTSTYNQSHISQAAPRLAPQPSVGLRTSGSFPSGDVLSRRVYKPVVGGGISMPVIAGTVMSSKGRQTSAAGHDYAAVSVPHFTLPFAAAHVGGGKTADQTLDIAADAPSVRQNSVAPPIGNDMQRIPLTGHVLCLMLLAIAYAARRVCSLHVA